MRTIEEVQSILRYRIIELRNLLLAYKENPHLATRLDELQRLHKELYGEEFQCPTTPPKSS